MRTRDVDFHDNRNYLKYNVSSVLISELSDIPEVRRSDTVEDV